MVAIAHHQPVTVLVDLVSELLDVSGDLGGQRRRKHLPGPVADDLIKQRSTRTSIVVGHIHVVNYREHGRTFPNQRANAGS